MRREGVLPVTGRVRSISRVLAVLIAIVLIGSCSSESTVDTVGLDEAIAASASFVDDRPAVLERLGAPDSFQVTLDEIEGVMVRFESWSYHDLGSRIDFVDGAVAWNIEIDDLPNGSLLPVWYSPSDFELLMTLDEAQTIAMNLSPAGQPPIVVDLSEGGEDFSGSTLLAGDQIILGFVDDLLIYFETIALAPDVGGGS